MLPSEATRRSVVSMTKSVPEIAGEQFAEKPSGTLYHLHIAGCIAGTIHPSRKFG